MNSHSKIPHELSGWYQAIASAWAHAAELLANWAMERLVNRADCWGAYPDRRTSEGRKRQAWTAYAANEPDGQGVTAKRLASHFCGDHIVGLHTTAAHQSSRWIAFDIDQHNSESPLNVAEENFRGALALAAELRRLRMESLVEDSNGQGGFHIWTLFDNPVPTDVAYHFGQHVLRTVDIRAETFPKQPDTKGKLGNWLRLPGRHHTLPHWSRFWDGNRWLEGVAATDWARRAPVNPADTVPVLQLTETRVKRSRNPMSSQHQITGKAATPTERQEALNCLAQLSRERADEYQTWLSVGMALHAVGVDLLDDWDCWSRSSTNYEPEACAQKWITFTQDGLGLGSLYYWAREDRKLRASSELREIESPSLPSCSPTSIGRVESVVHLPGGWVA